MTCLAVGVYVAYQECWRSPAPLIGNLLHGPSCCAWWRSRGASLLGAWGGRPFQVCTVAAVSQALGCVASRGPCNPPMQRTRG